MNAKRVWRLYREEGLTVRTKRRKKLASRARVPPLRATAPHQRWSMDFVHDRLVDGRPVRILTVIDQFTRECLALIAAPRWCGEDVAAALETVVQHRQRVQPQPDERGRKLRSVVGANVRWHTVGHEGNYAMEGILAGHREDEKAAAVKP